MAVQFEDEYFMRIAIAEAQSAKERDEVPIGACITDGDQMIIAAAGNRTIGDTDPTAHAEVLVLREAAKKVNNYRLTQCVLYTTIEPCVMCAGALVNARIKRLVYGAPDKRFGAVKTQFSLCNNSSLNHQIEITSGILEDDCRKLMQDFFRVKRLDLN
ncbi:MAG: tRNA adenosine(34) deaminase TadA [Acidobacteria bacterium]|nr:tRNA adenosine(34) deaminase TadA [Acidobacteriota bacterium]